MSDDTPSPLNNVITKRRARKSQSISPASRTSGWRKLMISSRGGRNRSSWRSSRGWLICLPRQRISPSKESRPPKSGIPNRKKTRMHTRLSCKIDYLLRSNHRDRSIASSFFTDDYLRSRPAARRKARRTIGRKDCRFREERLAQLHQKQNENPPAKPTTGLPCRGCQVLGDHRYVRDRCFETYRKRHNPYRAGSVQDKHRPGQ